MAAKWNGKSVYQLNQRRQRIHNLDMALGELNTLRSQAREDYLIELGRILDKDPGTIQEGPWSCEHSPSKICVYERSADSEDECLFCGLPHDRA